MNQPTDSLSPPQQPLNPHPGADVQAGPHRYFVTSFGCQMNVYDGERMGEMLAAQGMQVAERREDADLVILNTCHIREKAVARVYSDIGRLRRDDGSSPMIAVAGCVAQAEGEEIARRAPSVDIVVGPQAYHRLPQLIEQARQNGRADSRQAAVDTDMPAITKFGALPVRAKQPRPTAFLTVQEGCDKFCTYCVVPYTRGAEISRPFADLVDEARALVDGGVKEITLLGQNVNAWTGAGIRTGKGTGDDPHRGAQGLETLIAALAEISSLDRIRYTTSHPNDMTDALIAAHAEIPKLMPYLHLPVQSGSDRILKAMNRSHNAEGYLAVIAKVRAARPDIALSGDFIVGFPGETEADFQATLDIVRAANYAQAFSFKYSPRPGTPAADMADQISPELMDERLQRLQALLNEQQHAFNQAKVGQRTRVLLERPGRKPGQLVGKSPWLQSVHVADTGAQIGDMVDVALVSAGPNSLEGRALTMVTG